MEQEIFDELAKLCSSSGYVHAIAYHIRQKQHLNKAEALRQAQLALLKGGRSMEIPIANPDERGAERVTMDKQAIAVGTPFRADSNARFAHPYYWAPFILMGNWL